MKRSEQLRFSITFMILVGMVFLTITNINSQETSLGIFKQGTNISLIQLCQNSTYANITDIYTQSNSTYIINSETQMTKAGVKYNYTLSNTNVLGNYNVDGHCDINGIDTTWAFSFSVTPTGYEASLSQTVTMFFLIGILVIAIILLFLFGVANGNIWVKIFCLGLCLMLFVFLVGYILNMANINLGEFTTLTNGFSPLYVLFIVLLTVGGMGLILFLISWVLTAWWKHRGFMD